MAPKANDTHDISFLKQDGKTEIGLILARERGIPIYNEYGDPTLARQIYSGEPTYANLPPEKCIQIGQTDFRAGIGREIYAREDSARYWKSFSTDLRFKGMAIAGPAPSTITRNALTIYTFYTTSSTDGYMESNYKPGAETYNGAWTMSSAESGPVMFYSQIVAWQDWVSAEYQPYDYGYHIGRAYLWFDTSELPSDCTIASATLTLWGRLNPYRDTDATDELVIQSGQPTYPHFPLEAADFDKDYYSGDGGSIVYSAWNTSGKNVITLNATGRGWINKGGTTKFCLRTRQDISGTSPGTDTDHVSKGFRCNDGSVTGKKPTLTVTTL